MFSLTVAVIDECESTRAGLMSWFHEADPPIVCTGGYADPADYLRRDPGGTPVDCVVTEIQQSCFHAPDLGLLRLLCRRGPKVIVHSHMASHEVALAALDSGAVSYLVKSEGRDHLLAALRGTVPGAAPYVGPFLAEALRRREVIGRQTLSGREREVLLAWFHHESKDDVARSLHIATATVRTHLQRIRSKYALAGRPAPTKSSLLARAIEDGLVGVAEFGDGAHDPAGEKLPRAV